MNNFALQTSSTLNDDEFYEFCIQNDEMTPSTKSADELLRARIPVKILIFH